LKIGIIGTGYVGLVTGACMAEMGNDVVCQDIDAQKIAQLQNGKAIIYEPSLAPLISKNVVEERMLFTTDAALLAKQRIIFFCVGTPPDTKGNANLTALFAAVDSVFANADGSRILVLKSTVPVGTAEQIKARAKERSAHTHLIVSNPEFLKQGAAVSDFMKPDRIVIGAEDEASGDEVEALYKSFIRTGHPVLRMDHRSAELMKYAANALLATRITFMNQVANICDKVGADVEKIRLGLGADTRIGPAFLFAGVGWGGSCFGKDLKALSFLGRAVGAPITLAEEALSSNAKQPLLVIEKLSAVFGDLSGKLITLWGLSFKPSTDDVREAPSLAIAQELLRFGASLQVYDPKATDNFLQNIPNRERVTPVAKAYEALAGADALVLLTEWSIFRNPDFERIKSLLRTPVIIDGRNQYDPNTLRSMGFIYHGIGRK
jgi:UDPglucose 6-dehydrogenase